MFLRVDSVVCQGEFELHPCPAPEALNREFLHCASVSMVLLGRRCPWDFPSPARRGWKWPGGSGGVGGATVGDVCSWEPVRGPWKQRALQGEAVEKGPAGDLGVPCPRPEALPEAGVTVLICMWKPIGCLQHFPGAFAPWRIIGGAGVSPGPGLAVAPRSWSDRGGGRRRERRLSGSRTPGAGGALPRLPRVLWHRRCGVCVSEWPW